MIRSLPSDVRARFLIVGGSAALLTWLLRLPLGYLLPYSSAVLLAQAGGMAYGFVIYRKWVFTERADRRALNQIVDFLLVNLAGASVAVAVALAVNAMFDPLLAQPMLAEALCSRDGAIIPY